MRKKIVFSSFLLPVDQLAYSQHTLETAGLKNEKNIKADYIDQECMKSCHVFCDSFSLVQIKC